MARFSMEWFRKQEELKKQKEAEQSKLDSTKKDETPEVEYTAPTESTLETSAKSSYFKFHKNKNIKKNTHYFLVEELLVTRASNADTQRLNMFSNHINQHVHLKNPEIPKVFTNFEDQIGEYSIAYKKAKEDFTIVKKIVKNQFNYDLIIQYKRSKVYDIIHFREAKNITEDYGYKLNDCIPDAKEGDSVKEGQYIYKSDNYDDDGNYRYGVNLKAIYRPWKNLTYEDGVVISESAAAKLTSYKVEKTRLSINGNDVLLNLYGTDKQYKSFPKVGDHIDGRVLVASRRRDKRTTLYDFQASKMHEIDPVNDSVIYTGGGTVVDINIYNNIPLEVRRKKTDEFNKEILVELENQYRYWKEMRDALEEIIPCKILSEKEQSDEKSEFGHVIKHPRPKSENPVKYTDELDYYWKLAHENTDEKILWRYDGKSFDNIKIEFTILKENPLTTGCKVTGRYGLRYC